MPNWYASREQTKRALKLSGTEADATIDYHIEAASREIDRELGVRSGAFVPETKTRQFTWPQDSDAEDRFVRSYVLLLDEWLLSVSGITSENATVTVPTSEVFLEPVNEGPPYTRLEINKATTDGNALFAAGESNQRAVRVTGSWGYSADTKGAGQLSETLTSTETDVDIGPAATGLVEVGDTLLCETEQMFVSGRAAFDTTANTAAVLTASISETTVAVNNGALLTAGEVLLIDSERMLLLSISANNLSVVRGYDGTAVASHVNPSDVYAFRTLTVTRGVNGTTKAAHADATALTKYVVPLVIQRWCVALAVAGYEQDQSGHTGVISGGESAVISPGGSVQSYPSPLEALRRRALAAYGRPVSRIIV